MGNIIHQNILHFQTVLLCLQGYMGSKLNESYWQRAIRIKAILACASAQCDERICFPLQVQPAGLSVPERRHHAKPTFWHESLLQRPLLQVHLMFLNILLLSFFFPPHTSVWSPSQPHCQHVCDRWGHPGAEGRAHCWRPAGSVHNQPLRALPASKLRWIV